VSLPIRLTRRRFIGGSAAAVCVGCGGGDGTPGVEVVAGSLDDVRDTIAADGAMYVAEARAWLVRFPSGARDAALATYATELHGGINEGLVALYQRCPHQGCRVPYCASSGLFECPCHRSHFGPTGEYREGVSKRGLDHFPVLIRGDDVVIDATVVVPGLAPGSAVDARGADGPNCV
jgi:cytochrome b6-f complex iron-sulfur subunit